MPNEDPDRDHAPAATKSRDRQTNAEGEGGPIEDHPASLPPRPVRIAFIVTGGLCILFSVVGLVLDGWDVHDIWSATPAEESTAVATILVAVFGGWLLRLAFRPKGVVTNPILVVAVVSCILLGWQASRSRMSEPDDAIVRRGRYQDICPDWTIGEIMAHDHADVEWFSYLNKYGYRSVMVVCDGSRPTPSARMVWSIDEQDRFWVQYAERDGTPVDPYGLLATLCEAMTSNAGPTPSG